MHTTEEKFKAVKRELNLRRRAYPRWIDNGRISPEEARRQIAIFEEIVEDYAAQAEKERLL